MNNSLEILQQLKKTKDILKQRFGINQIAIYGSYARGEQKPGSDIDIVIVDIERKNAFLRVTAKNYLEDQLGIRVDIGLYTSLNPFIRNSIKDDLIYV